MKLLPNSFVSSSPDNNVDERQVLDKPPTPFAEPDPQSDCRMACRKGLTQADAIEWLTAPLTGATCYWGSGRIALRTRLLRELADELTSPAVAAGTHAFDYAWLRRSDGDLVVVRRVED